jgi:hypothetical protein
MPDHLAAALHFEHRAKLEHRPEERAHLLVAAREFRWLAIAEAKRFIRKIPKRPAAASVCQRSAARKASLKPCASAIHTTIRRESTY